MGPTRFERVTSRLSAVRSTWLSYGPGPHFALMIPLITVSLQRREKKPLYTMAVSLLMRSSVLGWVEKRDAMARPFKGLTMNR